MKSTHREYRSRYISRSDRKQYLYKLAQARSDIDAAGKACRQLLDHATDFASFLYYPLLCAVCVSYAKPFIDSKLGKLPKYWWKFSDKRMQLAHETMITTRHEIIAHNDPTARAVNIIPPGWHAPGTKDGSGSRGVGISVNGYYLTEQILHDCIDTCADLRNRLHQAVDDEILILYGLSKGFPPEPFPLTFDESL